ncbi:MAG: acyl-CoA thioesterase [Acidimicrobiia bacterium]
MDSRAFIGLVSTSDRHRFTLPVTTPICSALQALFGGAGLGAAVLAMESATGRRCVWASAQYLSHALLGEIVDLEVVVPEHGRSMSQARAVGRVGDREVLTVNAALGDRDFDRSEVFATMPDVPGPDDCEIRELRGAREGTMGTMVEMRSARARPWHEYDGTVSPDGRTAVWIAMRDPIAPLDAATLALYGDWIPVAVGAALGSFAGGISIDNTIRLGEMPAATSPSSWVLLDFTVDQVSRGFAHGHCYMWSPEGTLLATASQTCMVRYWNPDKKFLSPGEDVPTNIGPRARAPRT